MYTNMQPSGNRTYKDRLFRLLFSDKQTLLELYNALNQTHYKDPEDLELTTLDDVLYMKMKNDVSMLISSHLCLYEHQSTFNPNMPLRGLLYFAELYRQIAGSKHLYSTRLIPLPTPVYFVFYNGNQDIGEEKVLRLSDAFQHGNEQSKMELEAHMININYGHNKELMEQCRTLRDYSILVNKIKSYGKVMELTQAIGQAIEECIAEGVLRDFLMKRRSEVVNSLLTEYDEERVLADLSREFYEDGESAGIQKGLLKGIQKGFQEGIPQGENKKLTEQIQKKLQKNKTAEQIADELEEPLAHIQELIARIQIL